MLPLGLHTYPSWIPGVESAHVTGKPAGWLHDLARVRERLGDLIISLPGIG